MSNIPQRWHEENQWYFVTVVTFGRDPWLREEKNANLLMQCFREERKIHPFSVGALTILPDHWHCILQPLSGHLGKVGSIKKRMWHQRREHEPKLGEI